MIGALRLGEVSTKDLSAEDWESLQYGSWCEVCARKEIPKWKVARELLKAHDAVMECTGDRTHYDVCMAFASDAVAMGGPKGAISPYSVMMWILEQEHPAPWVLLRECTQAFKRKESVPARAGSEPQCKPDINDDYRRSMNGGMEE